MSFLGGPECSTASNPLAQFQKQTSADTSLQRDRLTGPRTQNQFGGFRSQQLNTGSEDAAFAEFQQQAGILGGEQLPMGGEAQWLEQLRREELHGPILPSGRWAEEFGTGDPGLGMPMQQQQFPKGNGFSPQDFAQFRQHQFSPIQQSGTTSPASAQSAYQRPPMYGSNFSGLGMGGMMYSPMWASPQPQQQEYQGKGKGRIQELSDTDWEKQFAELSTVDREQTEQDLDALDREAEQAMEAELNQMDRAEIGFGEFENIWQSIQAETNAARDMLAEDELAEHLGDEFDQWKDFDGMGTHDFDGLRTFDHRQPDMGHYLFEENNPFQEVPNAYEEGMKIMREGGNLSLAALAFEAAVQRDENFVDAWVALGSAQAQNEKETPAIRALEQALKLDSNNTDALMGLAVSYTNEGFDSLAYRTLERWIGVRYPQLGVTPATFDDEELGFTNRHLLHEKVTNLFLSAAQIHPEGSDVDVDVQVGLGVLFYGSEDYDKAVDCFTAALNSAQHGALKREGEEHLLWNRLGATLANSGRSEEAIEAYSRALELRPNFVRARYNLGVSCINLSVYEQAASHLLGALSMHRVIESQGRARAAELLKDGAGNDVPVDDAMVEGLLQQNQSTNLYDTLRRVFTQMNRRDLADMVGPDMDLARFKEFEF